MAGPTCPAASCLGESGSPSPRVPERRGQHFPGAPVPPTPRGRPVPGEGEAEREPGGQAGISLPLARLLMGGGNGALAGSYLVFPEGVKEVTATGPGWLQLQAAEPSPRERRRDTSPTAPPRLTEESARAGIPCTGALAPRAGIWPLLWGAIALLSRATASRSGKNTSCSEIILIQEIGKNGFHRDLLTRVKLGTNVENSQTCNVLIKYHLPSGLYVDPYELASLQEHNVTEAMIIQDTVDLEAPDYLSEELDVFVYAKSDSQCSECFRTILPVHCRYHQPEEKEEKTFVVVKNPELLVSCYNDFPSLNCWKESDMEAPCSVRNKHICQWSKVKYKSVNQNVTLQVPVGLREHCLLVCAMTLLVTVLCSVFILRAVFKHGNFSL